MKKIENNVVITKVELIREVCNDMCHNWYYLCHGRIYTENRKQYQKFRYIIWYDVFDVCEWYDKDSVSKRELREYANELAVSFIPNWNMVATDCKSFLDDCNHTINRYNDVYGNRYY